MALIVDRYAPHSLDSVILNPKTKDLFEQMIKEPAKKFKNMILAGAPGIGKTAIAKALVQQIGAESLFLNASKDNNVDIIRSKVSDFCSSLSLNEQIKVIILDEADCLSVGKSGSAGAQEVLRGLIEEHQSDCRFILTCNYVNRIIPALVSRCPIINIQFTPEQVLSRIVKIIKDEGASVTKKDLNSFYEQCIKTQFPNVRSIFHALDACISSNKFNIDALSACDIDNKELSAFIDELYNKFITSKNLRDIRQFYHDNNGLFDSDYVLLANKLFEKFADNPLVLVQIADYIYKMEHVTDSEIQFYAMLLDVKQNV